MIYFDGLKLLDESDKQPQWNLLTGTADFSGSEWIFEKGSAIDNNVKAPNGNATVSQPPWSQVSHIISITKGTYYTLSADTDSQNNSWYLQKDDGTNVVDIYLKKLSSATKTNLNWFRKSVVFQGTENAQIKIMCSCGEKNHIANMKLEYGTIATPWMPAITDLAFKSDLGGVKARYRLYYATSKEVA